MAGLDGVNPELVRRFLSMQAAAAAAGFSLGIGSGYRDSATQAQLRIKNGCPDVHSSPASSCRVPTARPGSSNHEKGLAIDISGNKAAKAWANANGAKFGLHFPVSGEDWHVEMVGDAGSAGFTAGATGGQPFDINWLTKGQSPEEAQDAMLQGYMDVITGAQRDAILQAPGAEVLATPTAPELESPGLAKDFTPDQLQPAAPRMEEVTVPGQPGAAPGAAGGGQFTGNVPPPGYVPPGSGVARWRSVALAALAYTGQDPGMVDLLLKRMAQESSGNERAINNWDINAKRGDPSKGLMQNIGSAFNDRARELSNRGIYDGFANIVASIRYTLNRYGNLAKGWGRKGGY